MRFDQVGNRDRMVFGGGLVAAIAVAACGSVLQDPTQDAGADSGRPPCRDLGETACRARTDCAVNACAPCGGPTSFFGCYDPATDPPVFCSDDELIECQAPCSALPETTCRTRPDCRVDTCPTCDGAVRDYVRCAAITEPQLSCPVIPCPLACADMATREACEARSDCHPVFVDESICACAVPGCCARFARCADGATALCKAPPIICDAVAPRCEGPYVNAYSGGCYDGCVLSSDCAVN
jgi:hypothetical protein